MTTTKNWIEQDLQICSKATTGPWSASGGYGSDVIHGPGDDTYVAEIADDNENARAIPANRRFITRAREGWPKALQALDMFLKLADRRRDGEHADELPEELGALADLVRADFT